jgi:transcriptional regulator with XRE-family HTH domain
VRRRRLASELRRHRELAGLTIDDVAARLECSASKISRIETGRVGVAPRDVRDMMTLYGGEPDLVDAFVQLSREARKKGWWHSYHEVFNGSFVGLEAEAARLWAYQALLVPGLLQTEDYMRAVFRAARPNSTQSEIDLRVAGRLKRQQLLTDNDPPTYWAVIDEAVLHRPVGGARMMREQFAKLLELAALPHVTLQIIPFSAGAHAGMDGPFLILGFPDLTDPDVVYVDNTADGIYVEEQDDVDRYTLMFDHLRAAALGPEATLDRISQAANRDA